MPVFHLPTEYLEEVTAVVGQPVSYSMRPEIHFVSLGYSSFGHCYELNLLIPLAEVLPSVMALGQLTLVLEAGACHWAVVALVTHDFSRKRGC